MNEEVFIPITMFVAVAFVVYYYLKIRSQERMAIIDKGVSGEDLKNLLHRPSAKVEDSLRSVKWGIILISLGLAIILGFALEEYFKDEVILGLIFLFPGIGLIVYYQLFRKQMKGLNKPE